MALSRQKPGTAAGLTILYVLLLPSLLSCVPMVSLATDIIFIAVGCSKIDQISRSRQADSKALP
jgi:MFS superfamily sulfate permease-like transporter